VEDKSNEITAIPKLLDLMDLKGAVVTIDAIGTQRDIAKKIVDGGGDYVLPVKENQPALHEKVKALLEDAALGLVQGLAVMRRGDGQSAKRGDKIGPNPTDRAKNGSKTQSAE
jgi:predicted transposase YbfD/YdcC